MQETAPTLEANGANVALAGVNVVSRIDGTVTETSIEHTFRNAERKDIEVVFTFPLPAEAVLLGLAAKLNDRALEGVFIEKAEASELYEKAIEEGDTPIMLEQPTPGVYTVNLGNLRADETAVITYRYAEMNRWHGDILRFRLPTVIAPRYGDPARAGYEPHQEPQYDPAVEHRYSFRLEALGELSRAVVASPTHRIAVKRVPGSAVITIADENVLMDRDLVVNFEVEEDKRASAVTGRGPDGWVAVASFNPRLPRAEDSSPRGVKIVVDCSGSMKGTSIEQARIALERMLTLLRPQDFFDIVYFGSSHRALFGQMVRATPENVERARHEIRGLDADMGGTETGAALDAAYSLRFSGLDAGDVLPAADGLDLLLITDGDIHNSAEVIARARKVRHRIFAVGVSHAVSEELVRGIAEETGGACELVTPNEDMAERIERHFRRIYLPRAVRAEVVWPEKPGRVFPAELGPVYSQDTVHAAAWFAHPPAGEVMLRLELADGTVFEQSAALPVSEETTPQTARPETAARLAAALELRALEREWRAADAGGEGRPAESRNRALKIATDYQLMSLFTNCLMILVRPDGQRALGEPELRKVSQMLAHGWHGLDLSTDAAMPLMARRINLSRPSFRMSVADEGTPYFAMKRSSARRVPNDGIERFAKKLNRHCSGDGSTPLSVRDIAGLQALGLPGKLCKRLADIVKTTGADEEVIVLLFLRELFDSYPSLFNPEPKKSVKAALHQKLGPRGLRKALKDVIAALQTA